MLIISREILDDIFEHARETYPEECCGILVGRDEGGRRTITAARRANNVSSERKHDRYVIDEEKLIEVIRSVRGLPEDVVGFYHSHPDSPSRPSEYDRQIAAWPGYSYLIASVDREGAASAQSWIMPDGSDSFVEEPVSTGEGAPA
jgi:proteasome lid subunit RPN8/RPN11